MKLTEFFKLTEVDDDLIRRAIQHYGLTDDPRECGWILPDGTMLDLRGRHERENDYVRDRNNRNVARPGHRDYLRGRRYVDHRDSGQLIDMGGIDGIYEFCRRTEAIRLMPERSGVFACAIPTDRQIAVILRAWAQGRRNPMTVEFARTPFDFARIELIRPTAQSIRQFYRRATGLNESHIEFGDYWINAHRKDIVPSSGHRRTVLRDPERFGINRQDVEKLIQGGDYDFVYDRIFTQVKQAGWVRVNLNPKDAQFDGARLQYVRSVVAYVHQFVPLERVEIDVPGHYQVLYGEQIDQFCRSPIGEARIAGAGFLVEPGARIVMTGLFHDLDRLRQKLGVPQRQVERDLDNHKIMSGFVTDDGRFLTRKEAAQLTRSEHDRLLSQDVRGLDNSIPDDRYHRIRGTRVSPELHERIDGRASVIIKSSNSLSESNRENAYIRRDRDIENIRNGCLLYHGTRKPDQVERDIRPRGNINHTFGKAIYFSTRPQGARFYGTILVYRLKPGARLADANTFKSNKRALYDGVIGFRDGYGDYEVAIFNPSVIEYVGRHSELDETKALPDGIRIHTGVHDAHQGEVFGQTVAYQQGYEWNRTTADKLIGFIDWSHHEGICRIQMIRVRPAFQRQGIGTAMVNDLRQQFPDARLDWGTTTPPGDALRQSFGESDMDWNIKGGWISDDGQFIAVKRPHLTHDQIAVDYFGRQTDDKNDDKPLDEWMAEEARDRAFQEGWIRITIVPREFGAEWKVKSQTALRMLERMIRESACLSFYLNEHYYTDRRQALAALKSRNSLSESDFDDHARALRQTGFWGKAGSGCIIMARSTGRILLPFRSAHVEQPHTWGTWGGAIDRGEDPETAARREAEEEAGHRLPQIQMIPLMVFTSESFRYHNFLAIVDEEFEPHLDWETERAEWFEPGRWPKPLHFGLTALLRDPRTAEAIRTYGKLPR